MKLPLIAIASLFVAVPVAGDAQESPKWSQAFSLYAQCLQDLGLRGNYTWTDGGASAARLAKACRMYGKTVSEECMALHFHPDESTCQATNVLYAQTVLKALHK